MTEPRSLDDERAVVGAVLAVPRAIGGVLVDEGLRPEHFTDPGVGDVFRALVRLQDRGEPLDTQTAWAELERTRAGQDVRVTRADLELLPAQAPEAGHARAYARRVVELAELRQKARGAREILRGVEAEDRELISEGEGLLVTDRQASALMEPEAVADELFRLMDDGAVERWPTPFSTLTHLLAGGWRPGAWSVLGGHSSHGKSVMADQIAEHVARELGPRSVGIYLTEMTPAERALRSVSRISGLPYLRLSQADLREGEHSQYVQAVDEWRKLGVGLVNAAGWRAEDVVRDARLRGWRFVVVDLFNELDVGRGETSDWDRAVRQLGMLPKLAECHLLVVSHVNESRASGSAKRPEPVLGDLRSTGMLKNAADNVLMVWRDQGDDGELLDEGTLKVRKGRNALLGGLKVWFRGSRMRFEAMV